MPVHAGQAMWKYTILTRPKYKLHQTRNDALLNVTLHFSSVNLHFSDVKCHLVKAICKTKKTTAHYRGNHLEYPSRLHRNPTY